MSKEYIGVIAGHSGDSLTDKLHEKGYKVALAAGRKGEPGTGFADAVFIGDIRNFREVIDFFNRYNVNKVIIGTGHRVVFDTAYVLYKNGFKLSLDIEKSLLAKDKIAFKKVLEGIGVLTPKYIGVKTKEDFNAQSVIDEIGLPCVVKSATDGVQPVKTDNINDFIKAVEAVFDTNTELMVEAFIDGGDCTVAVCNDGKNVFTPADVTFYSKSKEYNLEGFGKTARVAELTDEQRKKILDISVKIIKESGILGLSRIDYIIDNDIYVLEANSVMVTGYNGSAYPFFKRDGYDIAEIMVENSLKLFENT